MEKFTNREFKTLTNEVMRVAREITDASIYNCSVSLDKEYISLTIHRDDDRSVVGMIYFQRDRYCEVDGFKNLFNLENILPKVKFGKFLRIISQSYCNCDKKEVYFEF